MNPFTIFNNWFQQEQKISKAAFPAACCFTTIGLDGFPNSRFVSLKAIKETAFIVTGTLSSRKGQEISVNNKVALAFWWPGVEKQVRVQGNAFPISAEEADVYFAQRDTAAKIAATIGRQGEELVDPESLRNDFLRQVIENGNQPVLRPDNWGGYSIIPVRIELMEFREDRFHNRVLFELQGTTWKQRKLQP